jgi:hypothetical protein
MRRDYLNGNLGPAPHVSSAPPDSRAHYEALAARAVRQRRADEYDKRQRASACAAATPERGSREGNRYPTN